jgi:hypothetical protein
MYSDCPGIALVSKTADWEKRKEKEAKGRKTRKDYIIITQLLLLLFTTI